MGLNFLQASTAESGGDGSAELRAARYSMRAFEFLTTRGFGVVWAFVVLRMSEAEGYTPESDYFRRLMLVQCPDNSVLGLFLKHAWGRTIPAPWPLSVIPRR